MVLLWNQNTHQRKDRNTRHYKVKISFKLWFTSHWLHHCLSVCILECQKRWKSIRLLEHFKSVGIETPFHLTAVRGGEGRGVAGRRVVGRAKLSEASNYRAFLDALCQPSSCCMRSVFLYANGWLQIVLKRSSAFWTALEAAYKKLKANNTLLETSSRNYELLPTGKSTERQAASAVLLRWLSFTLLV